jgi:hypothetical protein
MEVRMSRLSLAAIMVLGITLAASVAARQGTFEYWKAGARTTSKKSAQPPSHSTSRQTSSAARSPSPPTVPSWTEAWFSDPNLVRRRIGEMSEAMANPMIGETYPLPRGGGFVCTQPEGSVTPSGGLVCVLQCTGPELGGRRYNWFYMAGSAGMPTLERVRWAIVPPRSTPRAPWRPFFFALTDSLSRVMGQPVWSGPDSMGATWNWKGRVTTMRLHAVPTRVDSVDMECVAERLAKGDDRGLAP